VQPRSQGHSSSPENEVETKALSLGLSLKNWAEKALGTWMNMTRAEMRVPQKTMKLCDQPSAA